MSDAARREAVGLVEFDRVWKRFRYGEVHDSLRDLLPAIARRLRPGARPAVAPPSPTSGFWGLSDVSFAVRPGEALGILGSNGAGKSTVLKVLTGILRPTHGRATTRGRVGALIELAAGFHPDLTGRENVFLQGSFMGMTRREIARKFDEIVEFSGISEFIDTPVKRYSSGMNARLGFSIAAHLDPDVLIVDEVLSVGDAAFQRKAFDRVSELVRRDIPVVVVSHQMEQLAALCTHAIVLDKGRVIQRGTPNECVAAYLQRTLAPTVVSGVGGLEIVSVEARGGASVASGERLVLSAHVSVREREDAERETVAVRVRSSEGTVVYFTDVDRARGELPREGWWYWVEVELQFNVPPGTYVVETYVWDRETQEEVEAGPTLGITVTPGGPFVGTVQMNARARVSHSEHYGPENAWAAPPADSPAYRRRVGDSA